MKILAIAAMALILAGCTSASIIVAQPAPVIVQRPIVVERPVVVRPHLPPARYCSPYRYYC